MDLFEQADIEEEKATKTKQRITELEKLITRYQKFYYESEAEISDEEFDALWDELKKIDADNPILKRIGSDVASHSIAGNFEKSRHKMPMGSQEKAANPVEFLSWAQKHIYDEYLVEYKLDGASLELQYEDGLLVRAVTRGDGETGDVITSNAVKMKGVVKELIVSGKRQHFTGGIRGEVIMTHDVHRNLFSDKANCRNAANGLMKRKDGTGSENLCVICYDAFEEITRELSFFRDEEEKVNWIASCGFNVVPLVICHTPDEVIDYRAHVMEIRKGLEFDIDGLVVKPRFIDRDDMTSRARPDKQIAFKFSLEEAVTVLRRVIWSESGSTYTPIGEFDGVELAGTHVQKASLVNPNTIRSLGVKIGSHIVVTKRGEIIPKIERVLHDEDKDTSEIVFPTVCSVCSTPLKDDGTRLYCPNSACIKRAHHQIEKWVDVFEIRDLGETLISDLFNSKKIRTIHDLYTLTEEELIPYFLNEESISKEKKSLGAEKVIKSIQAHRNVPLETFIAGFDIEGIGEVLVGKLISAGFNTLDSILTASEEQLSAVNGFGDITAHTLVEGLKENKDEIEFLRKIINIKAISSGGALEGKSFCFTGELYSIKRATAESLVKAAGGNCKSSVVKGLSYLVTNDTTSGSSKNRKAAELGIPVIDEKTFLSLVKQ